jgi:hypothetical protein
MQSASHLLFVRAIRGRWRQASAWTYHSITREIGSEYGRQERGGVVNSTRAHVATGEASRSVRRGRCASHRKLESVQSSGRSFSGHSKDFGA